MKRSLNIIYDSKIRMFYIEKSSSTVILARHSVLFGNALLVRAGVISLAVASIIARVWVGGCLCELGKKTRAIC